MDAYAARQLIDRELADHGLPPLAISEEANQRAFHSLRLYAQSVGVPIDKAVRDVVRFQVKSQAIARARSN